MSPNIQLSCFYDEKKVTTYILIKNFKNEMQLNIWQFPIK